MTIVQLEYIVAVDTYRHFATAAEKCFVTQPTLSMQIQKLEENLGVTIFDRSKHPVEPTKIGKEVIQQARKVINESKKIEELISVEKETMSGNLRIGVIPTIAPYLLPFFLQKFVDAYPDIVMKIDEHITENIIRQVKKDTIDVGIVVTPIDDPDILEIPLYNEAFVAYVSNAHPLSKSRKLDPTKISINDVWLLNEGHCFRNQVLNICSRRNKITRHLQYESGSLESLKKIVDKQGGITLLPELATLDLNETDRKKLIRFEDPQPFREVSLVVRKSFLKERLIEALRAEILGILPPRIKKRKEGKKIRWRK